MTLGHSVWNSPEILLFSGVCAVTQLTIIDSSVPRTGLDSLRDMM